MSISAVELLITTLKEEAQVRFATERDRDRFLITSLRQMMIDILLSPRQLKKINVEIDRSNDRIAEHYDGLRRSIMNADGHLD
jgi:hypothetical protein